TEGPRGRLVAVDFDVAGTPQVPEAELRQVMTSRAGQPYVEQDATRDQAALRSLYLDRGFPGAVVSIVPAFSDDDRDVSLTVRINEGTHVVIGDVTVVGNERVSTDVIRDQMNLRPGQPAGATVLEDARRRL